MPALSVEREKEKPLRKAHADNHQAILVQRGFSATCLCMHGRVPILHVARTDRFVDEQ